MAKKKNKIRQARGHKESQNILFDEKIENLKQNIQKVERVHGSKSTVRYKILFDY